MNGNVMQVVYSDRVLILQSTTLFQHVPVAYFYIHLFEYSIYLKLIQTCDYQTRNEKIYLILILF